MKKAPTTKLTKAGARDLSKKDAPFLPVKGDPADFWDGQPPKSKTPIMLSKLHNPRSKPKKVLTNQKRGRIIALVNKLNRKDDKMANDKQKTNKFKGICKAAMWTVFAAHQGFIAWLVITNFDNYIAVTAAIAGFGLAVVSVGMVGAILGKSYSK